MNCHDAREWLLALTSSTIGLTEWALAEAHLRRCPDCRQALADLQQSITACQPSAMLGDLRSRVRLLPATLLAGSSRAMVGVAQASRLGGRRAARVRDRLRVVLAIPSRRAERTITAVIESSRVAIAHVALLPTHLRRLLSTPVRRGARATGLVAASRSGIARVAHLRVRPRLLRPLPLTLAAGAIADARNAIPGTVAPGRDLRARGRRSISIPRTTVASVLGIGLVTGLAVYVLVERPVPGPAMIALHDPSKGSDPDMASTRTDQIWQVALKPPVVHVVGRLSVKDGSATERDLAALLVQAGGTQLGKRHDVRITIVDAVVPRSGYKEFTRSLARIGSWQIEAERSPLPRGVHMIIRVGE